MDFLTFSGPMWFLMVLLIFTIIYSIWRQIGKSDAIQIRIPKDFAIPKSSSLFLLAIFLGVGTFFVRVFWPIDTRPWSIPLGQIIPYFMMFGVGVVCVRQRWFEQMTRKQVNFWVIIILITMVVMSLDLFSVLGGGSDMVIFTGGLNYHAFLFAVIDNLICMGMIFILIKVFYVKFNTQGRILQNLSASAFHMYILHPPVVVFLSITIASLVLDPLLKILMVFPLAVFFCYLLSHYVIQKIHLKRKRPLNSGEELKIVS